MIMYQILNISDSGNIDSNTSVLDSNESYTNKTGLYNGLHK